MQVIFLLPTLGHPRQEKRIRSFRRLGVDVRVMAFERDGQLGVHDPDRVLLGRLENGTYASRPLLYARSAASIRAAAEHADVVYCFGTDLLALGRLATKGLRPRPQLVVEMGDIPGFLIGNGPRARLVRAAERRVLRDAVLVSTSPAYIDKFYRGVQGLLDLRTFLLENKVDPEVTLPPLDRPPRQAGAPLRIGWFGLLRCEQSWRVLKRLAERAGDRVQIELRGVPFGANTGFVDEVGRFDNIRFGGRYTVPDDLPEMFASVDVCWMVHHDLDAPYENWGWARSNRLYQAGWFRTPLIGQEGKDDAEVLRSHDLGLVIDITDGDGALEQLLAISEDDLDRWRRNMEAMPRSAFALTDEHQRLLDLLGEGR